jgi:hypothetical protein
VGRSEAVAWSLTPIASSRQRGRPLPREGLGLPRYVERDFAKYLECGVLAHGFARVRCESCKDELLVAFSCKGRGVCPSCNTKRAHVTAVHLVEQVLPHVPYRKWTLSFPHRMAASPTA